MVWHSNWWTFFYLIRCLTHTTWVHVIWFVSSIYFWCSSFFFKIPHSIVFHSFIFFSFNWRSHLTEYHTYFVEEEKKIVPKICIFIDNHLMNQLIWVAQRNNVRCSVIINTVLFNIQPVSRVYLNPNSIGLLSDSRVKRLSIDSIIGCHSIKMAIVLIWKLISMGVNFKNFEKHALNWVYSNKAMFF